MSVSKDEYQNYTEIKATFDDGDTAKFIESRFSKAASRVPRWVDYALSNTLNTTIQDDEQNKEQFSSSTTMISNLLDYVPIAISLGALSISIIAYVKRQKSDQFRIILDIQNKLEETVNRLIEIDSRLKVQKHDENTKNEILKERRSRALEYLNNLEFLALLINNDELKEDSIINHYKPSITDETEHIFKQYPDLDTNDSYYGELKQLLKKWGKR